MCDFGVETARDCHLGRIPARECHLALISGGFQRDLGSKWQCCAFCLARWQLCAVLGVETARDCHLGRISARDCHFALISGGFGIETAVLCGVGRRFVRRRMPRWQCCAFCLARWQLLCEFGRRNRTGLPPREDFRTGLPPRGGGRRRRAPSPEAAWGLPDWEVRTSVRWRFNPLILEGSTTESGNRHPAGRASIPAPQPVRAPHPTCTNARPHPHPHPSPHARAPTPTHRHTRPPGTAFPVVQITCTLAENVNEPGSLNRHTR
jgi:hypothetical protein